MAYSGDDYDGAFLFCGLLWFVVSDKFFSSLSLFLAWADILPYKLIYNRLFFHQQADCCISNTCYGVGAASGKNGRTSGG